MRSTRAFGVLVAAFLIAGDARAQGLGALFQQAKEQVKANSWSEALKTLDALDKESQKPGLEKDRAQVEPAIAFYRGISLANLGRGEEASAQFETYLAANPNASLDPTIYSKKAVKALEDARKSIASRGVSPAGLPSLAVAYRSFHPKAAGSSDAPQPEWADGPARFLLTAEEKKEWVSLKDSIAREDFIAKFWTSRDPTPGTPANELKTEFERRVAFADENFGQGEILGSMTDRGMVFVLLGPPTYVGRKPIGSGEDSSETDGLSTVNRHDADAARRAGSGSGSTSGQTAAAVDRLSGPGTKMTDASAANWREVWHYRHELLPPGILYQQVDFDFITRKGYGQNVLQRDSATLATIDVARKSTAWIAGIPSEKK